MKSVSVIATLLLGNGLLAATTADAANANLVGTSLLGDSASADLPVIQVSRRVEPTRLKEQCSVSHQGRYRDGRYRKAGVRYYEFDISVTSNCRSTLMKCLVRYRTLVYQRYQAGSRTIAGRAPSWESSLQILTLNPGATIKTSPLGPTRRNAGEYEIECAQVGIT